MMLGDPKAAETQALGMPGKRAGIIKGIAAIESVANAPKLEDGQWDHRMGFLSMAGPSSAARAVPVANDEVAEPLP